MQKKSGVELENIKLENVKLREKLEEVQLSMIDESLMLWIYWTIIETNQKLRKLHVIVMGVKAKATTVN